MRAFVLALTSVLLGLLAFSPVAPAQPAPSPSQRLVRQLNGNFGQLGAYSGAYVVDLSTGQVLYSAAANVGRKPASVEKLYTTSVALLEFGPRATLTTSLLGTGVLTPSGTYYGPLYLRGGGDPTFGSAAFDRSAYGIGATIQQLVANFRSRAKVKAVVGRIVGDESLFDSLRSTIESDFVFDPYMEGSLSALAFNRGLLNGGSSYVVNPPLYAAGQLASALRAAHVRTPAHVRLASGRTPAKARVLATVKSPPIARLIALTNTPSDNFFAETLAKGLGARFGGRGTTAAGVAVIRSQLARRFSISPYMDDGSGLSRDDSTSPRQVVTLLSAMAANPNFTGSLAIGGETGTLQDEMVGTAAAGNCRGKTGTLHDVASLAGYCRAADGHTLAFAFLANGLGNPDLGHEIEADMAVSLAKYNG